MGVVIVLLLCQGILGRGIVIRSAIFSQIVHTSRLQSVVKGTYFGRDVRGDGLATHYDKASQPELSPYPPALLEQSFEV